MRQITLVIHKDESTWWADSPDLPGFSAAADSLDALRIEASEGVAFELNDAPFSVSEKFHAEAQQPVWWKVFAVDGFSAAKGRARGGVIVGAASPQFVSL